MTNRPDTPKPTATFLRDLTGTAKLYKLDTPVEYGWNEPHGTTDHVVVSAAVVAFSGPETYIFPASEAGYILDWGELSGSYRGGLDHQAALAGAGYEVN